MKLGFLDVNISEFSESVLLHKGWERLCKKTPADKTLESLPCRFPIPHLKPSLFQLFRLILSIHIGFDHSKREVWHIVWLDEHPCVKCCTWSEHEKDISESWSGAKVFQDSNTIFTCIQFMHNKLSPISLIYNLFGYKKEGLFWIYVYLGEAVYSYFKMFYILEIID